MPMGVYMYIYIYIVRKKRPLGRGRKGTPTPTRTTEFFLVDRPNDKISSSFGETYEGYAAVVVASCALEAGLEPHAPIMYAMLPGDGSGKG